MIFWRIKPSPALGGFELWTFGFQHPALNHLGIFNVYNFQKTVDQSFPNEGIDQFKIVASLTFWSEMKKMTQKMKSLSQMKLPLFRKTDHCGLNFEIEGCQF